MNLTINLVGQGYKHWTSAEAVELVINPLLIEVVVVDLSGLSSVVNSLYELVDLAVLIEIVPEGFSVVWVLATSETLL